jgi:hypothetical protein
MQLRRYEVKNKTAWNLFVKNAKNSHFMFERDFMEYHSDRFVDNSLMFYKEGELMAVLPANIKDGVLYSHAGLTFGGLIYGLNLRIKDVLDCFESLVNYCKENSITKMIYKKIPYIYNDYPAEEDLYALFKCGANLYRRDACFCILGEGKISWNASKKSSLKKGKSFNLSVKECDDYENYHTILSNVLMQSHSAKPVHSLEEMKLLASKFPQNIKLVCSFRENVMLSGTLLLITKNVIHTQYIATSEEGKKIGAFECIVDFLQTNYKQAYLSFGISTENEGLILNESLAWQKESFGARSVTHDFYEITF